MQERRKQTRTRSYLGGKVTFNRRFLTWDCLIRNLTETGAKLEIPGSVALPHELDITIRQKGTRARARMIWRTETEMGVCFIDPPVETVQTEVVPLQTVRRLRQLEATNQALKLRVAELSQPE